MARALPLTVLPFALGVLWGRRVGPALEQRDEFVDHFADGQRELPVVHGEADL
ncbi:MAG: hypothetical protein ACLP0J_11545 [Solirubrobacteraceae bacterium]